MQPVFQPDWAASWGIVVLVIAARAASLTAQAATPTTLTLLVGTYFRTDDVKERSKLAASVETAAGGAIDAVAEAVHSVQLWSPGPTGFDFVVETKSAGLVGVQVRAPLHYDPAPSFPMVLVMPEPGASMNATHNRAVQLLGPGFYDSCIMVTLERTVGGSFHQSSAAPDDLRAILRRLRRLIHLDADRVFLAGFGEGGRAAWAVAIAHPDLFAGVIALSSHPRLAYPGQTYPVFLQNLSHLPVLTMWTVADASSGVRTLSVAAHNREIISIAATASLPIVGVETPYSESEYWKCSETYSTEWSAIRAGVRAPPRRTVSRWFRYPGQGHAGWLRQTQFMGDVWEDEQLSIISSPGTDRDRFITEVLKEKLAYLGGNIDGQTLTIETRKCAEVEVRFHEGLVDLSRPVTIIINGRKRHEGLVKPSIRTLLETAYEDWDFQRLTLASLSFSIRADTRGQ